MKPYVDAQHAVTRFDFFSGGYAIFTVANPENRHYTYKIRTPKDKKDTFFVHLLTSNDNTDWGSWVYLGMFLPGTHRVVMTKASKMNMESLPVKVLNWVLQKIYMNETLPNGYRVYHEGRCCRCGRRLTDPASIEVGMGPDCRERDVSR